MLLPSSWKVAAYFVHWFCQGAEPLLKTFSTACLWEVCAAKVVAGYEHLLPLKRRNTNLGYTGCTCTLECNKRDRVAIEKRWNMRRKGRDEKKFLRGKLHNYYNNKLTLCINQCLLTITCMTWLDVGLYKWRWGLTARMAASSGAALWPSSSCHFTCLN